MNTQDRFQVIAPRNIPQGSVLTIENGQIVSVEPPPQTPPAPKRRKGAIPGVPGSKIIKIRHR